MTLAIMQPYFLPYIGYFQLLNAVDTFVLYDDVNFINRGWINRNNILLGGKPYLFTIPLQKASQNRLIHEVHLAEDTSWRPKLLKTIQQAYQKAPYFHKVYPLLETIIHFETSTIAGLCTIALQTYATYLQISTTLVTTSRHYGNADLHAQDRILSICKMEKADGYINPIGGMDLYNKERFFEEGLSLHFIKSKPHTYAQFRNAFVPWLSILDVLMFNSVEEVRTLLLDYELV